GWYSSEKRDSSHWTRRRGGLQVPSVTKESGLPHSWRATGLVPVGFPAGTSPAARRQFRGLAKSSDPRFAPSRRIEWTYRVHPSLDPHEPAMTPHEEALRRIADAKATNAELL